jgi:hypothetical protein
MKEKTTPPHGLLSFLYLKMIFYLFCHFKIDLPMYIVACSLYIDREGMCRHINLCVCIYCEEWER